MRLASDNARARPGSPPLSLFAIAWPIFVEQSLRILIGTVDTFMVAHVSDGAVAALGVANRLLVVALICFNFIGVGTSVVITHHLGAGDRKGAEGIATTALAVNAWMGLAASLGVYLLTTPILRLMQLPPSLMSYAVPFLSMLGGTLFLEAVNIAIGATLRAHAYTRDVMFVTVGQNVLNIAGNCLALFGFFGLPKLGVEGVALSGMISRVAASLALHWLLHRRLGLRLRATDLLRLPLARIRRILHIGLPAAGENLSYWIALLFVTSFVARLGPQQLATMSYCQQIQALVMLFSLSLGLGTEIMVGRLIGAGEFDAAYHQLLHSLRTGLILCAGGVTLIAFAASHLIGLFTSDPAVIHGSTVLLRICVILEIGRVFNIIVINSLRATGDVRFPVQAGAVCMWVIWVPNAWFMGLHLGWGLVGVWISMTLDEWLRGVLMYHRWKARRWLPAAERSRANVMHGNVPLVAET